MDSRLILRCLAAVALALVGSALLPAMVARGEIPIDVVVPPQTVLSASAGDAAREPFVAGRILVADVRLERPAEKSQRVDGVHERSTTGRGGPDPALGPATTPEPRPDSASLGIAAPAGSGAVVEAPPWENSIEIGRWLNAGSDRGFPDREGILWEADRPWYHNAYGYEGPSAVITTGETVRGASGFGEDNLYQYQRVSQGGRPLHYRFYYGIGVYQARLQVDLRFAELEKTGPGERVFDVLVDGQPLVTELDLYAAAGPRTAYAVTRQVTVTYHLGSDLTLDIAFVPRVGEAAVAGVAVRSLSVVPQEMLSLQVAQAGDDTHVVLDDGNHYREPFVRFGRYNDGFEYAAGLLFRQVTVPRESFISSAWLEMWSYPGAGWQYGEADVTVYAQASDSAADFGRRRPRATVRPLTRDGVRWVIDRTWPANEACQSVDLAAAVQEVVARRHWRPGNNLALLLMPNGGPVGWRDVAAWDWPGSASTLPHSKAARLHITYVPPQYRAVQP